MLLFLRSSTAAHPVEGTKCIHLKIDLQEESMALGECPTIDELFMQESRVQNLDTASFKWT